MRLKELDIALKLHFAEGCMCTTGDILQTLTFEVRDSYVNTINVECDNHVITTNVECDIHVIIISDNLK